HTKQGSRDLILTPQALFITNFSVPARHGKSNFANALKKELYNKKIKTIEQHGFDRVVEIKLIEHSLVLEFVGEGNMVLIDAKGKILSCLKNEKWADRETKKGLQYVFPKPRGTNPIELDARELKKVFSESKKDSIRTLISAAGISPLIAEEIFFELKIDKGAPASGIAEKDLERICANAKGLYFVSAEKLAPVAYKEFAYPFALKHLQENPLPIKSLNFYLDEKIASSTGKPETKKEEKQSEQKVSKLEFHVQQQKLAREKFGKAIEENTKKAELIYANYNGLEELRAAILKAMKAGYKEKDIMYTLDSAASKGNKTAKILKSIDLQKKKFEVELP
ncbi:MAG: NFACT family protein, partial [archaeon]